MLMPQKGNIGNQLPLSAVFPQMLGDCTICTAMSTSGALTIGMATIQVRLQMAVPGQ